MAVAPYAMGPHGPQTMGNSQRPPQFVQGPQGYPVPFMQPSETLKPWHFRFVH